MNGQLAIDFSPRRHARRKDPATSHDAALRADKFAATHAGRIHAALIVHGPRSAHELETATGLTYVQIDRRMVDLVRAGKALATGLTAPTPSGGKATIWAGVR